LLRGAEAPRSNPLASGDCFRKVAMTNQKKTYNEKGFISLNSVDPISHRLQRKYITNQHKL
jgi:hypothetical protein